MDRLYDKSYWWYTVIGIVIGIACIFLFFAIVPPWLRTLDPTVTNLRGGRIIIISLPDPPEELIIYEDGRAARSTQQVTAHTPVTWVQLTPQIRHDLDLVRTQWCKVPPRFDPLRTGEHFYKVGIDCGAFRSQLTVIPVSQLPHVFGDLFEQVPMPITAQ
jgi:hypothetical protein